MSVVDINRKMYKKIKSMDRREMSDYVCNVYKEGITAGINEEIKQVKGVGDTKRQAIMERITKLYE